jgi:hypothetical protein
MSVIATVNPVVAERYIETRYGIAHVTLTKTTAFESAVSVEGNIGTSGPVVWCRNSVLDYAVDMYNEIADNTARLEYFIANEVL